MAKKRGLPKGQTNNPDGRPRTVGGPGTGAAGQVSVRLSESDLQMLAHFEKKWDTKQSDTARRLMRSGGKAEGYEVEEL